MREENKVFRGLGKWAVEGKYRDRFFVSQLETNNGIVSRPADREVHVAEEEPRNRARKPINRENVKMYIKTTELTLNAR